MNDADLYDPRSRLQAWLRDYGHEKQPEFVADLTALLSAFAPLRERNAELEKQVERLSGECQLLAMLAADQPQFRNERREWEAKTIRDRWLAKETT